MIPDFHINILTRLLISATGLIFLTGLQAQESETFEEVLARAPTPPPGLTPPPLPQEPLRYETAEGMDIEVRVIARGLNHPWGLASLPDGSLLVTERNSAQLRVIRDGVLDPEPVKGLPEVKVEEFAGLNDVVLHPDFADTHLVYLTYYKPLDEENATVAVLRGTWDGHAILNAEDIFVAEPALGGASRLLFDRHGMLYVSFYGSLMDSQNMGKYTGKVIRLTDSGAVPKDNPFIDTPGARPEIYTLGHRTPQGLTLHPETGEIWSIEMGPNGGDEINVLKRGANYGWPKVSLGRDYAGAWQGVLQKEGFEDPVVYWMPAISVSGMAFYTGDKLPKWQGDLFVGGLRAGQIPGTGQVHRIKFNELGQEIRRETLLADLRYRMRGVYQGVDGYLYVLTDEDDGAVLRIGPAT
jgi:glucose/arabinose dehydrogenase